MSPGLAENADLARVLACHCNQHLSTQSSQLQVPAQISPYHGHGTTVTLQAPKNKQSVWKLIAPSQCFSKIPRVEKLQ